MAGVMSKVFAYALEGIVGAFVLSAAVLLLFGLIRMLFIPVFHKWEE